MKKATLVLINGEELKGYKAGHFVVYKDAYYWYIAHESGYMVPSNFDRRKDAVKVCDTMGALADWDFDDPADADIDACRAAHASACIWDWKEGVFTPIVPTSRHEQE